MPLAGFGSTVKLAGTAVPVTGEATTSLGGGVYQVTSTSRRIWAPAVAVTVRDAGTPVAANLWAFDRLFGRVTFSGYTPSGAVTIDGSYLPVQTLVEVREATVSCMTELLDATVFESAGHVQKLPGLQSASATVAMLASAFEDTDTPAGGVQSLWSIFQAQTPKLLEVRFGATGAFFRGWVYMAGQEAKATVAGLVEVSLSMESTTQTGTSFGWGT